MDTLTNGDALWSEKDAKRPTVEEDQHEMRELIAQLHGGNIDPENERKLVEMVKHRRGCLTEIVTLMSGLGGPGEPPPPHVKNVTTWMRAVQLQYGYGVVKDPELAVALYRKGADEEDCFRCQNRMALFYSKGEYVEKNVGKAVHYYQISSAKGYPRAACNLARMYQKGKGVKADTQEAIRLYKVAAASNYVNAILNLSWLYRRGLGVPKDEKEADMWLSLVSARAEPRDLFRMALRYHHGKGVEKNPAETIRLLRLASQKGYARAQFALARVLESGRICQVDLPTARVLYEESATQGNIAAAYNLACMFKRQRSPVRDLSLSARWFHYCLMLDPTHKKSFTGLIHVSQEDPNAAIPYGIWQPSKQIHQWVSPEISQRQLLILTAQRSSEPTIFNVLPRDLVLIVCAYVCSKPQNPPGFLQTMTIAEPTIG